MQMDNKKESDLKENPILKEQKILKQVAQSILEHNYPAHVKYHAGNFKNGYILKIRDDLLILEELDTHFQNFIFFAQINGIDIYRTPEELIDGKIKENKHGD